jgi:hypothetical protein
MTAVEGVLFTGMAGSEKNKFRVEFYGLFDVVNHYVRDKM